ncbi:MAG: hypothetical protein JO261_01555 [Alphaproteobacteria bacterium]|nr:hypothetical protein [Alphaproteobacteria bacterium]MBV9692363.1 hypothetical protein [Alphaproteobacteria bacterium]
MRISNWKIVAAAAAIAAPLIALPAAGADQPKVTPAVGKPLSEAQKAMKANDFAIALTKAKEAQAASTHQPYDDYLINQFLGNIYLGQKDYKDAETAFEAMAASPAMPPAEKVGVLTTIIQLSVNNADWNAVLQYADQLQALGPLPANVVEPVAVGYYNAGQKDKAYALAKPVVDAAQAAGKAPPQALADIVTRQQLSSNNPAEAEKTLENLVVNYGDPAAWAQIIATTMFQTKGMHEPEALNFFRLRMVTNAKCTPDDYQTMASVANDLHYPVEAEMILEHGIANHDITAGDKAGSMLGSIRPQAAKDRATLGEFEKLAIAHKTGDFDVKLANTYMGYGRYADAAAAAQRALGKGGLKDIQEAELLLGMALAASGNNAQAVDALSKVNGGPRGAAAHLWSLYAQRKYGSTPVAH